jgi:hypothetical protein
LFESALQLTRCGGRYVGGLLAGAWTNSNLASWEAGKLVGGWMTLESGWELAPGLARTRPRPASCTNSFESTKAASTKVPQGGPRRRMSTNCTLQQMRMQPGALKEFYIIRSM